MDVALPPPAEEPTGATGTLAGHSKVVTHVDVLTPSRLERDLARFRSRHENRVGRASGPYRITSPNPPTRQRRGQSSAQSLIDDEIGDR